MLQGCIVFLVGLVIGVALVITANILCERRLRKRAFEKGWGMYDPETGQFKWVHSDAHYVFDGFMNTSPTVEECPCHRAEIYDLHGNRLKSIDDTAQLNREALLAETDNLEPDKK